MEITISYRDIRHGLIMLKKIKTLSFRAIYIDKFYFKKKEIVIDVKEKDPRNIFVPMRCTISQVVSADMGRVYDMDRYKSAKAYAYTF